MHLCFYSRERRDCEYVYAAEKNGTQSVIYSNYLDQLMKGDTAPVWWNSSRSSKHIRVVSWLETDSRTNWGLARFDFLEVM
jgi:hypothetical protein